MSDRHDPLPLDRFEQLLDHLPAPEPSAALRRAVAEIPLRHPQPAPGFGWLPLRSAWALFAAAALIVALGALAGAGASDLDLSTEVAEQAPESGADEDDLSELAFAAELDEELSP